MTEAINLEETIVVKAGNAFCVALRDGRLPLAGDHPLGAYVDDCRHLRGYELRVRGMAPRALIASDDAGSAAVFELTTEGLVLTSGLEQPNTPVHVRVDRRIAPRAMVDRISLHSYAREPVALAVEMLFDADFRTMLEVRGTVAPNERTVRRESRGDTVTFSAIGIDGRERSTAITSPTAVAQEDGRLRAEIALDAGQEATLEVSIRFDPASALEAGDGRAALTHPGADAAAWLAERTHVATDDQLTARIMRRSLLDLRMLTSDLDGHRYPAAGVPWFATLFGRDSIITALEALAFDPGLAESTLRLLAARLGTHVDDEHDEEPGKVLHELRPGELAASGLTPLVRYYGAVDATPLFLCLLCEHANWTGSLALFHELRPQVDAALRWIDEFGDLDGDGLLEYRCRSSAGLVNQGWKDSWDAIVDEHGDLLTAPIALVEVQGYAIAAKRRLARLFELDGEDELAQSLRAGAARMAAALERFWLSERGFYAMALDADKRPSGALASNQGHLLWALAVPRARAAAIRTALMGAGSYSGWGARTLSSGEEAFNPVGYHVGTIWPHDNALFAVGLRKYGFDDAFLKVFEGLLDAAAGFSEYRLPELFAGFARAEYEDPVPYPVACRPQAWAAGALPYLLITGLGLVPNALERRLCITRPSLPRQVSRVALQKVPVGDARVDLLFERVAERPDSVALTDVHIDGDIDVVLHIEAGRDQELAPSLESLQHAAGSAT
jgi:glycogen debranching enzyme